MTAAGAAANVGVLVFGVMAGRALGPVGLADVGRLLSMEFGLLSLAVAFQNAFAQAGAKGADDRHVARRFSVIWALVALPAVFLALGVWWALSGPSAARLAIFSTLAVSVPFAGALVAARGVALGRMDVVRYSASAVVEAAARISLVAVMIRSMEGPLAFALAAALSVPVGWVVLWRRAAGGGGQVRLWPVLLAAAPWLGLQAGQMAILEGDIFWASLFMAEPDAGRVALVTTFQRFQFMTAIGIASYVVPTLAGGGAGVSPSRLAGVVGLLLAVTSGPFLAAAQFAPAQIIALAGGADFAGVADALLPAAIGTTAFTTAYVALTAVCARGGTRAVALLWAGIALEGAILAATPQSHDPVAFYGARALALGLLCAVALLLAAVDAWRRGAQRKRSWASA